ncbi:MAG TPA: dTDP-glucose 4,6-dehydratase [Thermomicrobiales bacterium]|nr:dTDP-glucose 4,6-dehydratase [Thermomicrobiales bacterium]
MTIMVTGGSGFIGSAVVRHFVLDRAETVVNVDKLTYASSPASTSVVESSPRYFFEQADICDSDAMAYVFERHRPRAILHLAAESHVDRSIDRPAEFVQTNIMGTYTLLEATRRYLETHRVEEFRFVHVSTDEVFGTLGADGFFTEESPYRPTSPYSASKAASDHLARAWHHTYGVPVIVTNCSNNYGPFQYPEKLIPVMVVNALHGRPLPVYGEGVNVRDWLFVDDHARALATVLEHGQTGETYAIGGNQERSNLDLVHDICATLDELLPDSPHVPHASLIQFVPDRPGHDLRYAIDSSRIQVELGWQPTHTLSSGLRQTVEWYLTHIDWCAEVLGGNLAAVRQGVR